MKTVRFLIAAFVVWILLCAGRPSSATLPETDERLEGRQPTQQVFTPARPVSPAVVVVAVCAGAGLVVFLLATTFSGQSLASTRGSQKAPTGYRRRTWDALTGSPQF
jgi:multisubunit Na+/H+ antiporter MnhC subunit